MTLLENIGTFLVGTADRDHVQDIQDPCRTGAALQWLWGSGELATPLTYTALGKAGPAPCPGSRVELAMVAKM